MVRAVKFRAWDKKTNDWYDDSIQHLVVGLDGEITNCWNGELMENYTDRIVLLQYTGLKDVNGIEIYEGDIVQKEKWQTEDFVKDGESWTRTLINRPKLKINESVVYDSEKGGYKTASISFWLGLAKDVKVIGNIYENPELVEGDE